VVCINKLSALSSLSIYDTQIQDKVLKTIQEGEKVMYCMLCWGHTWSNINFVGNLRAENNVGEMLEKD